MLFVSVLMSLTGCVGTKAKTTNTVIVADSVTLFWGSKAECIEFLNSPKAQAQRWYVRAIQ